MKKRAIKIIIACILFVISLCISFENEWINKIIYFISYLIVGGKIILEAVKNIGKGEVLDENFLMTIATIGAFAIGEFPEAVAVMLFYQIGEWFQDYAVDKSRKSITNLMALRPDYANVKRDNHIIKITPEEVKIGETILVKPGEKIPLDGKVVEGTSMLDTSALTGETVPKKVSQGEEVLSGCVNQNGLLTIEVSKEFGESTVSKILELVENASSKKSKSENFIHKFAKYYTPIVVIIAVILAIVPPIVVPNSHLVDWIYRALTFLVVSCPCALVISIPLGFFGGIGGASKRGILVKGSNYVEALSKTQMVVFDKTGTLTQGVFEVQKVEPVGYTREELLRFASHAENYSNHPISLSIKKAYGKEINQSILSKTEELPGLGIVSCIEGKEILVGNEKLMEQYQVKYTKSTEVGTIVYVAIERKFAGYLVIADKIKEDAKRAVEELKKNHIQKIVMLTGDKKEVGESVAKYLHIEPVYTELLPNEKVEKVEEFIKENGEKGKVAFVGDGVNDAPVLALSDIGIAMGGLGADSAIEAADVVIMTDEPSKVVEAIQVSKRTMRIVKENIVLAISIKVLVLFLTAIGISNMWEAVFADVGVSILAIMNSLRALRVNK